MAEADPQLIAGRYRLVHRLAAGGMGSVWEGWDERLLRKVAVKQLHPQLGATDVDGEIARSRAMREARITARLHHPNAVPVYDVVDNDGRPCLIMQYLPSKSLQELVHINGPLAPRDVARIGRQIAAALSEAHRDGIVHRDVKPGNILITEDGTAKITDFGISHAMGDVSLTSTGMVTGTPAYLAPEVARGGHSAPESDVFSLGATLYFAAEGAPPFGTDSNAMAMLHKVASGQLTPPNRTAELTPLLMQMLAPNPADRPPMLEVVSWLSGPYLLSTQPTLGTLSSQPTDATQPTREMHRPPARSASDAAKTVSEQASERMSSALPGARSPAPASAARRKRRVGVVAVIAGLVVVGLAATVGILLANAGRDGGTSGSPGAQQPGRISSATSPSGRTAATSASSKPPSSSPPASSVAGAATASQLARAITGYYALVPGDTNAGWSRLTAGYRSGHAGGRQAYDTFWGGIKKVEVSAVTASPPSSVTATITYHLAAGKVSTERTLFRLVREGGILKIAGSSILSTSG